MKKNIQAVVLALTLVVMLLFASGCTSKPPSPPTAATPVAVSPSLATKSSPTIPVIESVYAATITSQLPSSVAAIPERVYVPNTITDTVDVIDPHTFEIIDHYPVGREPQHITPAWDLSGLYVDNTRGNTLTLIDPKTGKVKATIEVTDPYNLYFTPDGKKAIVVAEEHKRLDFRNPKTWTLIKSVPIPYPGVDHLDFSRDGKYLLTSTEFSGYVVKVDVDKMEVMGQVNVGGLPIDVRIDPKGEVFYVTNQSRNGVSVIDPIAMQEISFIPTGRGSHGLCVSRDNKYLYVSNRLGGTISVIDFTTRKVVTTWKTGGSPDMLQVSPDGRQLWASGRFDKTVYVVDTQTGKLIKRIPVDIGPHGLAYFPQPGRYSIGHNGVYR